MPIYEYQCRDCGSGFERLVRRFDEAVACPSCSSGTVEKQLSVFAVASSEKATAFSGAGACGIGGGCASGPCGGGACELPS